MLGRPCNKDNKKQMTGFLPTLHGFKNGVMISCLNRRSLTKADDYNMPLGSIYS